MKKFMFQHQNQNHLQIDNEKLIPINELPMWIHEAFKGARTLNRIQSQIYPVAFEQDENLLVCAPTGSGKTNVAILNEIGKNHDEETGILDTEAFKIVYICPDEGSCTFRPKQEFIGVTEKGRSNDSNINICSFTKRNCKNCKNN